MTSSQAAELPQGYRPKADEHYMNAMHLAYFRNKLLAQRDAVAEEVRVALLEIRSAPQEVGDEADMASRFNEIGWVIEGQERIRRTLVAIDAALKRIDSGDYGYCEETGEEIGLDRLEANPTASLTMLAQERRECCLHRDWRGGPGRPQMRAGSC